jgi:hypothetical protein
MVTRSPIGSVNNIPGITNLTPENGKVIGWSAGNLANVIPGQSSSAKIGSVKQNFQSIVGMSATVPLSGEIPFYLNNLGTGASVTQNTNAINGTLGVINIQTGTTTTGVGGILARQTASGTSSLIYMNTGDVYTYKCRFRLPVLSDAVNIFAIGLGFFDQVAGTVTNGVWLSSQSVGSGLVGACRAGGVTTTSSLILTPTINTWYDLEIVYTSSLCTFTVNGQSQTVNSNIPQGSGRRTGYAASIGKLGGTTTRLIEVDFVSLDWNLA